MVVSFCCRLSRRHHVNTLLRTQKSGLVQQLKSFGIHLAKQQMLRQAEAQAEAKAQALAKASKQTTKQTSQQQQQSKKETIVKAAGGPATQEPLKKKRVIAA